MAPRASMKDPGYSQEAEGRGPLLDGKIYVGFMEEVALGETPNPRGVRFPYPSFPSAATRWPGRMPPPTPPRSKAPFSKAAAATRVWALPSAHRMTADGFLHSGSRLGSVMGPLVSMTRQDLPLLAPGVFGALLMASALVVLLFLPETRGFPLPDTIQDLERQ